MSLAKGWTADGWFYSVYWNAPWFQVEFTDGRKEIWRLLTVEVVQERDVYVVMVSGRPLEPPIEGTDFRNVLVTFAKRLRRDLETKGSDIIRGQKLKILPYGETELLWWRATSRLPTIAAKILMEERAEVVERAERERVERAAVETRHRLGLSSEVRRYLKSLFYHFLSSVNIEPTAKITRDLEYVLNSVEHRGAMVPSEQVEAEAKRQIVELFRRIYYEKKLKL